MKAFRESTLFLTSALEGGEGSESRPGRTLPLRKTRFPLYRRPRWASGSVWTGAENLAPTGIRSPDRPAHRQSLYRLSYPVLKFSVPLLIASLIFMLLNLFTTCRGILVSYFLTIYFFFRPHKFSSIS